MTTTGTAANDDDVSAIEEAAIAIIEKFRQQDEKQNALDRRIEILEQEIKRLREENNKKKEEMLFQKNE
jgi:hypothetical protein